MKLLTLDENLLMADTSTLAGFIEAWLLAGFAWGAVVWMRRGGERRESLARLLVFCHVAGALVTVLVVLAFAWCASRARPGWMTFEECLAISTHPGVLLTGTVASAALIAAARSSKGRRRRIS